MISLKRALADLSIGETGRILRVEGPAAIRNRLREMGLTVGVLVRLVRTAPFGDPIELHLRGYRLSLRKAEAAGVIVEGA